MKKLILLITIINLSACNTEPKISKEDVLKSTKSREDWFRKIYYECEIKIYFDNGTDIVKKIEVYERLNNIWLKDGDLSYQKISNGNDGAGVVAVNFDLASSVLYYEVLSSKKFEK